MPLMATSVAIAIGWTTLQLYNGVLQALAAALDGRL